MMEDRWSRVLRSQQIIVSVYGSILMNITREGGVQEEERDLTREGSRRKSIQEQ